jgi:hypothetical protein
MESRVWAAALQPEVSQHTTVQELDARVVEQQLLRAHVFQQRREQLAVLLGASFAFDTP